MEFCQKGHGPYCGTDIDKSNKIETCNCRYGLSTLALGGTKENCEMSRPGCLTGLRVALVIVPRSCKARRRCNTQQFGPKTWRVHSQIANHVMGISAHQGQV